ncbi:hypothetical protein ACQEVG_19765 [Streptomyces sp. CA-135486]|uniref:hypothetical protein n=1 Tax=Streptomyces sp. CA-135486 TaxID=3240049 RepID=UPI003D8E6179
MTPRLRTQCAIIVASFLLLATPVAYAEESEASDPSPTATPVASASLAGRQAGEGRPRPGRPPRTVSPSDDESDGEAYDRGDPARTPSTGASVSPSASVSASRSAATSAAPSHAHPAKPDPPPAEDEALEKEEPEEPDGAWAAPTPTPTRTAPAAARHQGPQALPEPIAHQISPLSLGIGMALMGLGIGFLGVRLRRR